MLETFDGLVTEMGPRDEGKGVLIIPVLILSRLAMAPLVCKSYFN